MQGRFLLSPSPGISDIEAGILARAARLYDMAVHYYVFLSNHLHLLLSPRDAQHMAQFMGYLNSNLAREIGRSVGWREKFWGDRYHAVLVSDEEGAQVARLRYLLSHGVKENLVETPADWPGATALHSLLSGEPAIGHWRDRTLESRAARTGGLNSPEDFFVEESLELTPLPCWQHLSPEEIRSRVVALVSEIESDAKSAREESGRTPLGVAEVSRQHPHLQAPRLARGSLPLIHAASALVRQDFLQRYREFQRAFRAATTRWRTGTADALCLFPAGSFPPFASFVPGERGS